jgi:LmbE family N-acetylglucosaminyl deacetylase
VQARTTADPLTRNAAEISPIDGPGTSEADWRDWPLLGQLPETSPDRWSSAVILAAHPDDEVLGAGGTIARLAARGCRLRLIAATDGESSHPGHPDPAALAERRTRETRAALQALGATDTEVIRLGLPDAGLTGRHDEIAARLAGMLDGFDICLAPWEHDARGDHEAAGRAIRQADVPACFYPVWMWHWARPGDSRVPWAHAQRIAVPPPTRGQKQAAIACFSSQLEARGPTLPPMLPAQFLAHFTRDYEVLFPVEAVDDDRQS